MILIKFINAIVSGVILRCSRVFQRIAKGLNDSLTSKLTK